MVTSIFSFSKNFFEKGIFAGTLSFKLPIKLLAFASIVNQVQIAQNMQSNLSPTLPPVPKHYRQQVAKYYVQLL